MRTSRIATVLLALAPTAILGNPVPILKAGVITNDHSLAGSENTNHGLCNRDDHDCPTKTVDPGDLCINAHATMICTPGGEGNPNFNQNTKRSESADSINLEATVVEAAAKVEARDDTDPDNDPDVAIWNCSQTSLRQYTCTGGPDNETCIFDDGRQVSCTSNQKTAALQTNTRDGGDPDFTCDTDVTGDYVCTGADVRCIIGKQGDATCSFNGPDGSDGDASKFKVNTDRLALVLSPVAPKPKDDSDPFDANPNYSCAQISDWTWSCGPNGVGPGSGNEKGKSLDIRGSDDEHYDPGQGCNQPQGFFGGCNGKRASNEKREVEQNTQLAVPEEEDKKVVNVEGPAAGHYDPGQGCNQPQGVFGGCDGKGASAEKRDADEKLAVGEGDEKYDNDESPDNDNFPGQGWQPSCFFGGCNGK